MKYAYLIVSVTMLTVICMINSCTEKAERENVQTRAEPSSNAKKPFLDSGTAAVMLGKAVILHEYNESTRPGVIVKEGTYRASDTVPKVSNLYFMLEEFTERDSAKRMYHNIRISNKKSGIRDLAGIGEEAYFHTDKENFYFMLVLMHHKVYRLKISKITPAISEAGFIKVSREWVNHLH